MTRRPITHPISFISNGWRRFLMRRKDGTKRTLGELFTGIFIGNPELRKEAEHKLEEAKEKILEDAKNETEGKARTEDEWQSLEHAVKISQLYDILKPPVGRRYLRILAVAILILCPLVVLGLSLLKQRSTELEMDIKVTGVSFALRGPQTVLNHWKVDQLGVSFLRDVTIPGTGTELPALMCPNRKRVSVKMMTDSKDDALSNKTEDSSITLKPSLLPSGTWVTLQHQDRRQDFRFCLKYPEERNDPQGKTEIGIEANLAGTVKFSGNCSDKKTVMYESPKLISLKNLCSDEITIDLTDRGGRSFLPKIAFKEISFVLPEPAYIRTKPKRDLSTVLSGTLYFEALNGKAYGLRHREEIRFEQCEGEIRLLQLHDDHISMILSCTVNDVLLGKGENSIMPSRLEVLRADTGITLVWTSVVYFVTLALVGLRWTRRARSIELS